MNAESNGTRTAARFKLSDGREYEMPIMPNAEELALIEEMVDPRYYRRGYQTIGSHKGEARLCPVAVALYDLIMGSKKLGRTSKGSELAQDIFVKNWPREYVLLIDVDMKLERDYGRNPLKYENSPNYKRL